MPFAILVIWREPKDHFQDYFCLVNAKGFSSKHRKKITNPKIDEVVFDEDSNLAPSDSTGSEYEPEEKLKPILFSQEQLNDLMRPSTF